MQADELMDQQDAEKRKKGCGIAMSLTLLVVILLLIPTFCYLGYRYHLSRCVEDKFAEIRATGAPVTAEELEAFYEYPPPEEDATELWVAAAKVFNSKEYEVACGDLPIVGTTEKAYEKEIPPPGEPWEDLEEAEKFLEQYADALKLLHEAAEMGGKARYPVKMSDTSGDFAWQDFRGGRYILKLKAHVEAHRRDAYEVARQIHALLVLARSIESQPLLICRLQAAGVRYSACSLLHDMLPHVDFSNDDIALIRKDITEIEYDGVLQRTLIGDRAYGVAYYGELKSEWSEQTDLSLKFKLVPDSYLLLYLEAMEEYIAAAKLPWPRRLDAFENLDETYDALGMGVASVVDRIAWEIAQNRAADAALAIEQFSRKHDRLPKTLDELVPEFLDSVPLDPFNGLTLGYVVRDDAYVVYSVGEDRTDDGGKIMEEKDEFGDPVENPDIVFPVKRKTP